jgi:ZIP family zinc transporter|uniref:hypothetical protein n=1 Tax=Pigmentiphaga litoralis TaxID=516702 RepID=UPI00389B38B9
MGPGMIALITLVPWGAAVAGGWVAAVRRPSPRALGLIQHFAAGVVFAGLAGEVIPDIQHRDLVSAFVGFLVGVPLVLGIRKVGAVLERRSGRSSGLAFATAVDLAVDGLPVAIGFVVGGKTGLVLTVALALELLVLSMSVAGALPGSRAKRVLAAAGLGGLFWVSANTGALAFGGLPSSIQTAVLAIGAVVFLYLAAEELLTEAHEVKETSAGTVSFFAGFLVLLLIELIA